MPWALYKGFQQSSGLSKQSSASLSQNAKSDFKFYQTLEFECRLFLNRILVFISLCASDGVFRQGKNDP